MKLLRDKIFEEKILKKDIIFGKILDFFGSNKNLEKIDKKNLNIISNLEELETFISEIREGVGNIFSYYNDLIVKGEDNILEKTQSYINKIKENTNNYFLKKIFKDWQTNDKGLLVLASRFYDKELIYIKDLEGKFDKKIYESIAYKYKGSSFMMGTMIDPHSISEPWDLWYFSNIKELEEGFIREYIKLKKIQLNTKNEKELLELLKKFHFKYSYHTNTYLKSIYIKGSFDNDREDDGDYLGVSIRKKFVELAKKEDSIVKRLDFVIPSETSIKNNEKSCVNVEHRFDIVLQNDDKIGIVIIDDELITLSVDKTISKDILYAFLEELYFETKKELVEHVKNNVDNILCNFSSEESNIINQYNYLVKNKSSLAKGILSRIDINQKTFKKEILRFITKKTHPDEFGVQKGGFPSLVRELVDEDIILMGISRGNMTKKYITGEKQGDHKKYLEINSVKSIFEYIYKLEGILLFKDEKYNKKLYDKQKEELLKKIITYDYNRLKEGKEIDWSKYYFDEKYIKKADFLGIYNGSGERIDFLKLYSYKDSLSFFKELIYILDKLFLKLQNINKEDTLKKIK